MSEEQLIHFMQCGLFRLAEKEWKKTPLEIGELFKKYDLYGYIEQCYGLLHVSSYSCALRELENILKVNGVVVNG